MTNAAPDDTVVGLCVDPQVASKSIDMYSCQDRLLDEDLATQGSIRLSDQISAVRVHKLVITLKPLVTASSGSNPRIVASRWEVRKALLSLCSTQPLLFQVILSVQEVSWRTEISASSSSETPDDRRGKLA